MQHAQTCQVAQCNIDMVGPISASDEVPNLYHDCQVLFLTCMWSTRACAEEKHACRSILPRIMSNTFAVVSWHPTDPKSHLVYRWPWSLLSCTHCRLHCYTLPQGFGIKGDLFGLVAGRQTYVIDKAGKCIMSFNDQACTAYGFAQCATECMLALSNSLNIALSVRLK